MSSKVDGSGDPPLHRVVTAHSATESIIRRPAQTHRPSRSLHVGFAPDEPHMNEGKSDTREDGNVSGEELTGYWIAASGVRPLELPSGDVPNDTISFAQQQYEDPVVPADVVTPTPALHNLNSPFHDDIEKGQFDNFGKGRDPSSTNKKDEGSSLVPERSPPTIRYTSTLKTAPRLTFIRRM